MSKIAISLIIALFLISISFTQAGALQPNMSQPDISTIFHHGGNHGPHGPHGGCGR